MEVQAAQAHDYQTTINVLLTLLGLAVGIAAAYFGIIRQMNKLKIDVAVQDVRLTQAQATADLGLKLDQEVLAQQTKLIEQNNLLINQIIAHSRVFGEPS